MRPILSDTLLRPLHIDLVVLCQIAATVGGRPAEFGGMLGAGDDDVVRHFVFDSNARRNGTEYNPDTRALSRLYREVWKPRGIRIVGFVHSHPPGTRQPSWADAEYAARLLAWRPELDRLLMPIVMAEPDSGRFEFLPYVALRGGSRALVEQVALRCMGTDPALHAAPGLPLKSAPPIAPKRLLQRATSAAIAAAVIGVLLGVVWFLAEHLSPAGPMMGPPTVPEVSGPIENELP